MPVTPNLFKSTDFVVGASGQVNVSNPDGVTKETVATFNEPPKTLMISAPKSPTMKKSAAKKKKRKTATKTKKKKVRRSGRKNRTLSRIKY
jgi:hypothetical protein